VRSSVAAPSGARPFRAAAATLLAAGALAAAACGGSAEAEAPAGAGDTTAAGPSAEERRAADSLAAWRAKFGNRVPRPDSVRALYVNAWAAGSRSRMAQLIRIADETEINAFIVDIKESDTYLSYDSTGIALAKEIGADGRPATRWLPALVDTLQAHGIYPIARIVVFKDRMLAEKKPELAIRHVNGGVWKDNKGLPWVNPYDERVWDYNIAIAKEALDMGFSELQWDYVRFPDVTSSARATMSYPGADGKSRAANIRDFITYSKQQLAEYQVPVTADVFGLVTHVEDDLGIGQHWETVIQTADVVLPMTYPSHYYTGLYGFQKPGANPYEILRISLTDAVERTRFLADSANVQVGEVMPWLEAMSIRGLDYGPAELREQIQATYDAGLKSWALWNPGSKFDPFIPALRPDSGGLSPLERGGWKAPEWTPPRGRLSKVIVKRDRRRVADSVAAQRAAAAPASGQAGAARDTTAR
jgi:hypothetical protein